MLCDLKLVELLIDRGAKINDLPFTTPPLLAAIIASLDVNEEHRTQVLRYLLQHGASPVMEYTMPDGEISNTMIDISRVAVGSFPGATVRNLQLIQSFMKN